MVTVSGWNLEGTDEVGNTVTINGCHVYSSSGKYYRSPTEENWNDPIHCEFCDALFNFEAALKRLINQGAQDGP